MFATLTQAEVEQRETQKQVVNVSGVFSVVGFHGIKFNCSWGMGKSLAKEDSSLQYHLLYRI